MDSPEKFSNSKQVVAFLAASFPQCFSLEGQAKPLKIGIFQELADALQQEPRVSKTMLRSALRHYTTSWRYLHAVKEGSHRVDLAGNKGDSITKEHAEHALEQLRESKQRVAERKQQADKNPKRKQVAKQRLPTASRPKTQPAAKPKTQREMPQTLTPEQLVPGTNVTVKVGKVPVPAVINEVSKDGIQVQLQSGMQVRVDQGKLRLAVAKR